MAAFRPFSGFLLLMIAGSIAVASGTPANLAMSRPAVAERPGPRFVVTPPPADWKLAPFYQKSVSIDGFPVVASDRVSDVALREAAYLIDRMLDGRDDLRESLIRNRVRLAVMAVDELTVDIPEHSDLMPAVLWNRRSRGMAATHIRPAVSCGEENLLGYSGDPYAGESVLIHEFAHTLHQMALNSLDPSFDSRLKKAYDAALEKGLWKGKHAATNHFEYWAEGVQCWFDGNQAPDPQHNHVRTREQLIEYDPGLAGLIESVFGKNDWRYTPPSRRTDAEHLTGYSVHQAPVFRWATELQEAFDRLEAEKPRTNESAPRQPADTARRMTQTSPQ